MKIVLVLIAFLGISHAVQAEEIIGIKLSKLQDLAVQAIIVEEQALGIQATKADVSHLELALVRKNEIEVSAAAPGYERYDGIPNFCSVLLKRATDLAEYTVHSTNCGVWD